MRKRLTEQSVRRFLIQLYWSTISAAHQKQQQCRSHALQNEPAGHHLLVAPALVLAHMIVQRGAGVLEDGDVQEALQADLQDAQLPSTMNTMAASRKAKGWPHFSDRIAMKKPMARLPASPISRLEGFALDHR